MKKRIATLGILALAACGGGDAEPAVVEDTTAVVPATEVAPVVVPPATDTTMGATGTMPMDSMAMPMDSAADTTAAPM